MPRRDGTGPFEMGQRTGKGAGYCNTAIEWINSKQTVYFEGYGCGRGSQRRTQRGGKRQHWGFGVTGYRKNDNTNNVIEKDEKAFLNHQEAILDNQLKRVKERLSELE